MGIRTNSYRREDADTGQTLPDAVPRQAFDDMRDMLAELTSSMWPRELSESGPLYNTSEERKSTPARTTESPSLPSLLSSHPYSAAFVLGATLTASALAGVWAARRAMARGRHSRAATSAAVLAEFTADSSTRLARLERLVRESHESQAALADQLAALPQLQSQLSRIERRLADMEGWKVAQLHSRLTGVESSIVGQWRDSTKAFDKVTTEVRGLKDEVGRVGELQGEVMGVAQRLDNFGKWSEVEVLNVLEGMKAGQEAALRGMNKSVEELGKGREGREGREGELSAAEKEVSRAERALIQAVKSVIWLLDSSRDKRD